MLTDYGNKYWILKSTYLRKFFKKLKSILEMVRLPSKFVYRILDLILIKQLKICSHFNPYKPTLKIKIRF